MNMAVMFYAFILTGMGRDGTDEAAALHRSGKSKRNGKTC